MVLNPKLSKVAGVKEWLTERIEHQLYGVGERVPSVRALAAQLGVSIFTVTQAYEQLVASGRIQARRGAGYFVAPPLAVVPENTPVSTDKTLDTAWLMQHLFGDRAQQQSSGSGVLPAAWLRYERMPTLTRQVAATLHRFIYKQSDIQGYLPLREQYCRRLHDLGVRADPASLITTDGVSSAITLVSGYLLNPGDAVIVDDPGWFWLIGNLQAQGLRVFGVQRDQEGPDIEQLHGLLQGEKARLYVTNSVLHNPTGYNLHPSRAYQVLNLLHQYNAYVLEDDVYGAYDRDTPALRYGALDRDRVFYTTSVSKVLGGNWRQGVLCCPNSHQDSLLRHKMLSCMNSSELSERLVYALLTDSEYRKHINKLRNKLQAKHDALRHSLPDYGLRYPDGVQGGFFLWLDTGCDSAELALAAHRAGWLVAPGQLFSPRQSPSTHIRANVACTDPEFLDWLAEYAAGVKR